MRKKQKTYSESFKKKVVIKAMRGKKTVAGIATSNNIVPRMVSTWKKVFINGEFSKDLKCISAATISPVASAHTILYVRFSLFPIPCSVGYNK